MNRILIAAIAAMLTACGGGADPAEQTGMAAPTIGGQSVVVLSATGAPTIGAFLPAPYAGAASAPGPVGDDGGE